MASARSIACCAALIVVGALTSSIACAQQNATPVDDLFGTPSDDLFGEAPAAAAPTRAPGQNAPAQRELGGRLALPAPAAAEPRDPSDFCRCVGDEAAIEAIAKISRVLRAPIKSGGLDFVDTPLEEVVAILSQDYGIPIQIDSSALDDMGVSSDEPITIDIHGVSLGAGLRRLLSKSGLAYTIHDEVLLITSPEVAERLLRVCTYDVRDLVRGGRRQRDFDSLIDTIVSSIATDTWAENGGGNAEIRPVPPGFLVISQTQPVHDEISGLLTSIRELKTRPPAAGAAAAADDFPPDDEVATRSFRLRFGDDKITEEMRNEVRSLILAALPDGQWQQPLAGGQTPMLAVIHDRIIIRHREAALDEVEELLRESGIAGPNTPNPPVFGGGGSDGLAKPSS